MLKLYEDLLDILKEEVKTYEEFYFILEDETEILTHYNNKDLEANNIKKYKYLEKIEKINQKREDLLETIKKDLKINDTITLKKIVSLAPEQFKKEFLDLYDRFLILIHQIKEKNAYNQEYIKISLRRIKAITNNLLKFSFSEAYDNKGKKKEIKYSNIMQKEA